jgi:hypothetical protein
MIKKTISTVLTGCFTLMFWAGLINGIQGFRCLTDVKKAPEITLADHSVKEHFVEPGRYLCIMPFKVENIYPEGMPVLSDIYNGMGSKAMVPLPVIIHFLFAIISVLICALLLSPVSDKIFSGYPRKILFVFLIGLLFTALSNSEKYGIGPYQSEDTLIFILHNIVMWMLIGLMIVLSINPVTKEKQNIFNRMFV